MAQAKATGQRKTGRTRGAKKASPGSVGAPNEKTQDPHATPRSHATGTEGMALHEIPRNEEAFDMRDEPLSAPPARPGMVQRWIRVRLGAGQDASSIQRATQGGWRPRLLNTIGPEHSPPTVTLNGHEYVGVDDVVLMERPKAWDKREREREEAKLKGQTDAVMNQLQSAQQPGGPRINVGQRTTVTRGNRQPRVQQDQGLVDELADSEVEGGEEMRTQHEEQLDLD